MDAFRLRSTAWVALAVGGLGLAPLAQKAALESSAAPLPLAASAATVAAVLVLLWRGFRGGLRGLGRLTRRQHAALWSVGALGSALVPLLAVLAMIETSASTRAVFQSAYPAATAVATRFLLGERLSRAGYAWIVAICAGLLAVNVDPGSLKFQLGTPFWLLLATLPAIGLADVIAKRSLHDLSPDTVAVGRAVGGAVLLLSIALPVLDAAAWRSLIPTFPWVVLAGVCMGLFAIGLYHVFDRTAAAIGASLIALAPLVTVFAELFVLDAVPAPAQWLGFGLVMGAVIGLIRSERAFSG